MSEGSPSRYKRFLEDSSFIRFYLWKYRKWVGVGLVALVIVDTLEVLPPLFIKYSVDIVVERRPSIQLAWLAVAYIGIALVQAICRYLWRMYLIRASILAGRDIRSEFAGHLFGKPISFFDTHRLGTLMSLASNDIDSIRVSIGTGVLVFADALFYLFTIPVSMWLLSPQLTYIACLPLLVIPFIVFWGDNVLTPRFERVQECFGRLSSMVQENLSSIRIIKGFGKEDIQLNRVRKIGEEYKALNLQLSRVQSAVGPYMDFSMSMGMILFLFWGGKTLIQDGESVITLGTFVAFQRYIQKMVWPMSALGMSLNYYRRGVSSGHRLKRIMKDSSFSPGSSSGASSEVSAGTSSSGISSGISNDGSTTAQKAEAPVPTSHPAIEFRHLTFRYPGSETNVLSDISFQVDSGERVALVGPIGAGKSTLLSLIPKLYRVGDGMIWVQGIDINQWLVEELRHQVGYVGQDVFLFSDTITENLSFALPTNRKRSGITLPAGNPIQDQLNDLSHDTLHDSLRDPVAEAAEKACITAEIHEEILRLTAAYRTRLGEKGINLSGGQKQRLTIARALVKQPSLLILDDALSSVDMQTEDKILKALCAQSGKKTELFSAHRMSSIKSADRIVVLDQGKISQMGTHSQLVKERGSLYWHLVEQQKFEEELEAELEHEEKKIDHSL